MMSNANKDTLKDVVIKEDTDAATGEQEEKSEYYDLVYYTQGERTPHEAPTVPDVWAESTPTISQTKIAPYIESIKRSSQSAIHNGGLCALEILNLEGVSIPEQLQSLIEASAANIAKRYIKETSEEHNRWLHKHIADITSELITLQNDKKELTQKIVRQRKAILDFVRDGDLAKLKALVYSG